MNVFWWCWGAGMLFCLSMACWCNYMGTRPVSVESK